MSILQYAQIIAIVVLWVIYIYGLFKVIRGRSANKWNIVLGFTFATLLLFHLTLNAYTIAPADWVQIMLTFGLVLATIQYAISAAKQADASVKMAEQMRKQTETLRETVSMSVHPSVSIEVLKISGGDNYPFEPPAELYIELQNTGKGSARNLVVTCESQGKKVEYSKIELPSLNVGDKPRFSIHRTTPISGDELRVAYVLLKALYNDELGEIWSTTLQIDRDGKWKAGEIITERG